MTISIFQSVNQDVQRILRETADTIIKPAFHAHVSQNDIVMKPDLSVVTKTDLDAQRYLEENLVMLIPQSGFLGEEDHAEGAIYPDSEWLWVVDPIDGTHNFASHNIDFGTMVALWHVPSKKPVYGWIYMPIYDVMLSGGENVGVFSNNEKVIRFRTSPRKPIKEMMGLLNYASFGEAKDIMRYNGQIFDEVTASSCAALKFSEIITGKADFGAFGRAKLWDLCAGFALLEAIGGHAAKIDGGELTLEPPKPGQQEWCLAVHDKENWRPVRDQLFRDVKLKI